MTIQIKCSSEVSCNKLSSNEISSNGMSRQEYSQKLSQFVVNISTDILM